MSLMFRTVTSTKGAAQLEGIVTVEVSNKFLEAKAA